MTIELEHFEDYIKAVFGGEMDALVRSDMHGCSAEMLLSASGVETAKKRFSQVFQIEGYLYNVRLQYVDLKNQAIVGNYKFDQ